MDKMLRDKKVIALFVLPCLLVFALIIPIPLCMALGLSFTKWDLIKPMQFVGLKNFTRMFTSDAVFRQSIGNTAVYLLYSILMQLPLAYFLALILSGPRKLNKFFQNAYYVPVALSASAVSMMFYFVYHPEIGVLNGFIRLFNKDFEWAWLASEKTAMLAVCFKVAWQWVGYHMILFVAGITSISTDLLEAAKVDGAAHHYAADEAHVPRESDSDYHLVAEELRFGLRHDRRRPDARHGGHGLVDVFAGVPRHALWLRRGDRRVPVRAVRGGFAD